MLAVVHDEQHFPVAQVPDDGVEKGAARLLAYLEGAGHGLGHELRLGEPRQLHQPRPVRVRPGEVARDLQR